MSRSNGLPNTVGFPRPREYRLSFADTPVIEELEEEQSFSNNSISDVEQDESYNDSNSSIESDLRLLDSRIDDLESSYREAYELSATPATAPRSSRSLNSRPTASLPRRSRSNTADYSSASSPRRRSSSTDNTNDTIYSSPPGRSSLVSNANNNNLYSSPPSRNSQSSRRSNSRLYSNPLSRRSLSANCMRARMQRSQSTHLRLQSQGLQSSPLRRQSSFAVQSIHRGSDMWATQLKPFVADLAFRSISVQRGDEIAFTPYTCQAALLFVDLSGYSRITAAIAHKGAHVISAAVNAYLERLLKIIHEHGGDVIKFAGDAILVVWEGDEQELEINVLCAARCVVELQVKAGEHKVEGTSLSFQIHCGLCCGPLDSEIFESSTHDNMQRLYHYVGGDSMAEIGDLVDLAGAGEICVSRNCFNFLESGGSYKNVEGDSGAKLLKSLTLQDAELVELMDWHVKKTTEDRKIRRNRAIEEEFIHNNVLAYLNHGGLSPTQIAQMRYLVVLFIAMTSKGSSVNWLMEVQAILDRNRCPIVQIIQDDKGVHIIAAVNLYEAVPEASLVGLEVCRELVAKRVGVAVGMAQGPTFCGVTGSSTACRWDITGPAVVRAARLMQYAMKHGVDLSIDQSLYDDPMAATRMLVLDASVSLKGTAASIAVYTLSDAKLFSAFRILENVHGSVHNDRVQEIQNHISGRQRSAVVVTGIALAGMAIVCQRAAGYSDMVPFMHLCEVSAGFLQLGRTIATWFQYVDNREVKKLAGAVLANMQSGCWSYAHDQCVILVSTAIAKGYHACFVVDRIQNLDRFSLSLIRECLLAPERKQAATSLVLPKTPRAPLRRAKSYDSADFDENLGQICFLCTHLPFYSLKSASDLVQEIIRSHTSFKIPIIEVGEASKPELRCLIRDIGDIEVENRWLDAYAESSGYAAEYFLERCEAVRNISAELWKEGKPALMETSEDMILHIPLGLFSKNKDLKVTQIRAEVAMRFSQIYDEIPPLCQVLLKVVTIATRRGFYKLKYNILWEALNDLIAHGVERSVLDSILGDMVEICVIKIEDRDERTIVAVSSDPNDENRVVSVQSPALADIAMDVCTPVQVHSIASVLIDRLTSETDQNFQVSLVIAGLHCLLKQEEETVKKLWSQSYQDFLEQSKGWTDHLVTQWLEIFDEEIRHSELRTNAKEVLGDDFSVPIEPRKVVSPCISLLRMYVAPVSLGPMGQSLSVICRNTFHEYGSFHWSANSSTSEKLRDATNSASGRYMMEMTVVENFLREHGLAAPGDEVEAEMQMISFLANPAENTGDVETKAVLILEEIIPRFIEHRLQRLYKMAAKLRTTAKKELPSVFCGCQKAIRLAYEALQANKSRNDAAQDALMILATMNWKPQSIPEFLPLMYQQTVANVRNATLKRLSDIECVMLRHQQGIDDLEVFLIITQLLQQAHANGLL